MEQARVGSGPSLQAALNNAVLKVCIIFIQDLLPEPWFPQSRFMFFQGFS